MKANELKKKATVARQIVFFCNQMKPKGVHKSTGISECFMEVNPVITDFALCNLFQGSVQVYWRVCAKKAFVPTGFMFSRLVHSALYLHHEFFVNLRFDMIISNRLLFRNIEAIFFDSTSFDEVNSYSFDSIIIFSLVFTMCSLPILFVFSL